MKKFSVFSVLFICLMALGLMLMSCDGGGPSTGPRLEHVFLVTDQDSRDFNWQNERSSFAVGQGVAFLIYGHNPEYDVNRISIVIKKGGTIVAQDEINILAPAQVRPENFEGSFYSIIWGFGTYPFTQTGNDYRAEVYIVDIMGNKSNTITKSFTVN